MRGVRKGRLFGAPKLSEQRSVFLTNWGKKESKSPFIQFKYLKVRVFYPGFVPRGIGNRSGAVFKYDRFDPPPVTVTNNNTADTPPGKEHDTRYDH